MKKKCFIWVVRAWLFLLPVQTHYVLKYATLAGHDWPLGEVSIYLADALFFIMCIAALLARSTWRHIESKNITGLVIFVSLLAISVFVHHEALNTWVLFLRFIQGMFIVAMLAIVPDTTKKLFVSFIAGVVLSAAFGIWQFAYQSIPGSSLLGIAGQIPSVSGVSVLVSSIGRFLRAYGTFPHPNIFGGYVAVALLMLVTIVLRQTHALTHARAWSRQWGIRYGWVVIALILFAGLAFSFSRSAWLGLGFAIVGMIWLTVRRGHAHELRVWVVGLCIPLLFLTINASVFVPLISERILARESVEQVSLEDRHRSLEDGWSIIKEHWAEGIGLGRTTYYIEEHSSGLIHWWEIQPPHNIFILLAVEASVFTAIALLALFYFLIRDAYLAAKQEHHLPLSFSALGFSALLLLGIIGLFDHYLVTLPSGLFLLFLVFGFAVRNINQETS